MAENDDNFNAASGLNNLAISSDSKQSRSRKPPQTQASGIGWHQRDRKASKIVVPQRSDLPAPPSMRGGFNCQTTENEFVGDDDNKETVAVFNANTPDGNSMVRALASSGLDVVAIVRVFTSKLTKTLLKVPRVTVKVADSHDEEDVHKALKGVSRAFLCLKYWEKYDNKLEESQAFTVLRACAANGVKNLVFSAFEDTKQLRQKGLKSQIVPDSEGNIHPKFETMQEIKKEARKKRVILTHMITSYLDQETSKKSLCLIVGENGKLIVQPNFENK